ncbi:MAG TPA: type II toxin-antitoxin system RelE/ParE family toxin [Candidatus Kapabacteria bacterium]|nr:type II toxin-antitoxin system RelE/ParE family toxin [Candidatus Kapabacteria bacterium]HPO64033.1 type II toxin-antitoxin system RelE/ParE family toxin [Candidatus Kapabacteria bacterium]
MYKIILSKQVQKFLDLLSDEYVRSFQEKLNILSKNPFSRETNLDIVPLIGKPKGFYRIRIGNYRFLYEIRKSEIIIYFYKAESRGDVYKK